MSTRIRYRLQKDGCWISERFIPIANGEARITLVPHEKYAVVHLPDGKDLRLEGTSLHKIKIKVKDKLIELGAEFLKETRNEYESE